MRALRAPSRGHTQEGRGAHELKTMQEPGAPAGTAEAHGQTGTALLLEWLMGDHRFGTIIKQLSTYTPGHQHGQVARRGGATNSCAGGKSLADMRWGWEREQKLMLDYKTTKSSI